MPIFRYQARDKKNEVVAGVVQAVSTEVAEELLADQGFTIFNLKEEKEGFFQKSLNILNRVKIKDLVVFSRQLAVIISATIPLVQGLRILVNQTENEFLRGIISEVADDVEGGAKLSAALSRHPKTFSNFYISIIKSGETAGKLDEILSYLADQQERDYDLISKIRGAMIYPIFILAGLFIVGTLMMVIVVPQLTSVLKETGAELPLSTKVLIEISNFLVNFWWLLFLIIIGGIVALGGVIKTRTGRHYWDLFKLRLPIFGKLFQKIILVRTTRSLNTLMAGGVTLSKSLEIVADVAGNSIYHDLILETRREVESGNPIATVFLASNEVPPMVSQMLSLGEKTGRLDEILNKLANFYEREVSNTVNNLTSLLEPLIMLIMGVAVGLLVAAIILPMYNLASSL